MKTGTLALAVAACIPWFSLAYANGDEQQDAATMEQILAEVQKTVPPAWLVEVKLADPISPGQPGPHPTLVIKSAEPLPVGYMLPSQPPLSGNGPPQISKQVVAIEFVACPFLPPERYNMAREHNDTLLRARLQFQSERMKTIPSVWKGPMPFPPQAYHPRSQEEVQRVRQYAFLWVSTEPRSLPTHRTANLAFKMVSDNYVYIADAKKAEEYQQILRAVQRIIVPYASEP
jgi:hypothetical protein